MAYQPNDPNTLLSATGSLTALNQAVTLTLSGQANATFQLSGTWVGTVRFEASNNGTNWTPIFGFRAGDALIPSSTVINSTNNDVYRCTTAGFGIVRVIVTAYTSGTIAVTANATNATSGVFLNFPLPVGNNNIGTVEIADSQTDIHGQSVGVTRITQIATKFFQLPPASFLTINVTGTGAATQGTGTGIFSTGTGTTSSVNGQTPVTILYAAQYEAWAVLSASFTAPTSAVSTQRLGIFDAVNGFSFGYNGLTFGLWTRFNSVDTFIPQTSWNTDVLNGDSTSLFRSGNTPVALVPTNINMFRIRYGWYGSVDTYFEMYAPDGDWVIVHKVRTANSQTTVNLTNPNLPMRVEVTKTASDATNLIVTCGGWAAGISAPTSSTAISGQQNITALNEALLVPTSGMASFAFSITGTWVGTLSFQYSLDGINWTAYAALDTGLNTYTNSTTTNRTCIANTGAFRFYRIIATAWTSGTASIIYNGASEPSGMSNVIIANAATPSLANVASSVTSVTLRVANTARRTLIIANDSTAILYIVFGAVAASTTNYTIPLAPLVSGVASVAIIKGDDYSGEVRGIWAAANGNARITEVV